jgi:nucleoside 2-deoxyribosyltransferase
MSDAIAVYLAGPINGCTDAECKEWRHTAKVVLHLAGCEVIDPMRRDYRGTEDGFEHDIVTIDRKDIESCDIVLANVNVASWGTAMEIAYAWSIGKKVIGFATHTSAPSISPWLRFHCRLIADSLGHAIDAIARGTTIGAR